MEWVETTGKTVDVALEAALEQLGVLVDDAEYEVLDEGRAGLFGRRAARVRARVRPTAPRAKDDRRDRKRRRGGERPSGGSNGERGRGRGGRAPGSTAGDDEQSGKRSDDEGRRQPARRAEAPRKQQTRDDEERGVDEGSIEVPLAELGEQGAAFVAGLVDAFGLDATVASHELEDDMVEVRVDGADLGILIGPRGQTLAAVQELARTVAQRRGSGSVGRLVVEVSGYRRKRRLALESFALQVASAVVASGERQALEPMVAADRKVVHDTLTSVDGVSTSSEGEEPRRRVVILPS